jgi:hypothetical protein
MKIACPRCGQDWVLRYRIASVGATVSVCGECEALWRDDQEIAATNFIDMSTYLCSLGLRGEWKELQPLTSE